MDTKELNPSTGRFHVIKPWSQMRCEKTLGWVIEFNVIAAIVRAKLTKIMDNDLFEDFRAEGVELTAIFDRVFAAYPDSDLDRFVKGLPSWAYKLAIRLDYLPPNDAGFQALQRSQKILEMRSEELKGPHVVPNLTSRAASASTRTRRPIVAR
jgi:hypothetical protein